MVERWACKIGVLFEYAFLISVERLYLINKTIAFRLEIRLSAVFLKK
ncbi:hypothetical protein BbiDN127_D0025 (plasmid) [Borreliella bissettiae DN127]|uniref:Uncharacterized protein n=1 Tax=Borrelia bissettiae (strain DSM 17990 / CIP 109136 / DN127) TaxID=521010 RepID=G0AP01_BORBD|nr:hypothetical protein BbiDN127_D0025 [Borreliella bissettiae DN127]